MSCRLSHNVEKYCTAGQTTARAHFLQDNQGYKHKLKICNIYCVSTATVVARTRLNVAL